jgi:hypothetical protein
MNKDGIDEGSGVPVRPDYKIPKGAQEAREELMGKRKLTQDEEPKSAKIMKFM